MSTASTPSTIRREFALAGQTVVVIGGSAGIGLEAARLARAEGAKLILAFGKSFDDLRLLQVAYGYEQATKNRKSPQITPPLPGERFEY